MRKALIIMIAMFISLNVAAIAEEPTKDVNYETVLSKTSSNNRPRTLIPDTIECCYSYIGCFDMTARSHEDNLFSEQPVTYDYNFEDIDFFSIENGI
jgi:hypothetical protein